MGVFRSEEMECYHVLISKSVVYQCVATLGELELIEIIDINPEVEKLFAHELTILDKLDMKLRQMIKDLKLMRMSAITPDPVPKTPPPYELANLGGYRRSSLNLFNKLYDEYKEVSERCQTMKDKLTELVDKHRALLQAHKYMLEVEALKRDPRREQPVKASVPFHARFTIQVGVMPQAKCKTLETLVWRLTQGNAYTRFFYIEPQKHLGKFVGERKTVVLISVQGIKSAEMVSKLFKSYNINLSYMSWKPVERTFILNRVLQQIFELRGILNEVNGHRKELLKKSAESCKTWFVEIEKMKLTYNAMNKMDWSTLQSFVIMAFWVPKSRVEPTFRTLMAVTKAEGVNNPVPKRITHYPSSPPTYIRTNKFTIAFQHIIDAYGIPSYRELNPMPYTIITFPFLFAIMFGDVGHGIIMVVFASTVIMLEDRIERHGINNEIFTLIFKGRYIILLMGIFSIWTGIIYNDYFSQSLYLPYSHWAIPQFEVEDIDLTGPEIQLDPATDYLGYPFPIGLDPVWKLAENDIIFSNTIKMKVAIIIGVVHMTFGIVLNLFNHIHFKNYLAIFTEFIPQLIFFSCLFTYLVFLFFLKWGMYSAQGSDDTSPYCAPSLLITFINMMMFSYQEPRHPDAECKSEMYPLQPQVQLILLLTALLCVPIMFFIEPIVEICRLKWKKKKVDQQQFVGDEGVVSILVFQFIHVIEFCLGSVSYTASYLRLWALSLAHYQLSSVLWRMVLKIGTPEADIILGIIISLLTFVIFAMFTIAILVVIEGLSAFLHALRLHWMEFQSKFYIGLGHYFSPLSFRPILQDAKIPVQFYPVHR